jgi:hypothetical protein
MFCAQQERERFANTIQPRPPGAIVGTRTVIPDLDLPNATCRPAVALRFSRQDDEVQTQQD